MTASDVAAHIAYLRERDAAYAASARVWFWDLLGEYLGGGR